MSVTSRSPVRMAGANCNSGNVNTGEFMHVRGGGQAGAIWSGGLAPSLAACPAGAVVSGNSIMLWSGAGRLNSFFPHTAAMLSGLSATFYDTSIITASGTSVSGQKIIGILPLTFAGPLSGNPTSPYAGQVFNIDMPFSSGLCVSAASGVPGFSFSFTPEVGIANPG